MHAATEAGGIGAECGHHIGLYVFEDLVLIESVDERDRPVPDGVHAGGWQVREEEGRLRVLIARPGPDLSVERVTAALSSALEAVGAAPIAVSVEVVDAIAAGAAGKRPLVIARRR